MKRGVIFSGAPTDPALQPPVPKADYYLCADSGLQLAHALHITPDWTLGDFDSLGYIPTDSHITVCPIEKDDTDTVLAAKYAIQQGCQELVFYGALGGRLDHMLANLQMLQMLADVEVQGILVDAHHWITLQRNGTRRYPRRNHTYFSMFSVTEYCRDVTAEGVKYPLRHDTLSSSIPIGVSNEIVAEEAIVTVGEGDLLVVYANE